MEEDGKPHKINARKIKNTNTLKCILDIFIPPP
jgi:hypothetical protein